MLMDMALEGAVAGGEIALRPGAALLSLTNEDTVRLNRAFLVFLSLAG